MKYRPLGKSGLQVSEIGFGGWAIGGNQAGSSYGTTDDATSLAALNQAYELGCTFFDTADCYGHGHSETLIGQALKGWKREEVIVATTVGLDFYSQDQSDDAATTPSGHNSSLGRMNFSEKHIRSALEKSLQRLGTDRIDVYQLQTPTMELIHLGRMFSLMQTLQSEGKIRFFGIVIHDPMEGIQAIDRGHVQTVQAVYNLFDRRPEPALFAHCEKEQVGLIAREPLANGFLTGKFTPDTQFETGDIRAKWPKLYLNKRIQAAEQFKKQIPPNYPSLSTLALKFVLAQPMVSVVIPGCKTPQQVVENMSVSDLPDLTPEEYQNILTATGAIF